MTAEFTRRNLFKIGGLAAAGLGGAALLGACSPAGNATGSTASDTPTAATGTTTVAGHVREGLPSFLAAPEPITDIAETKDYDVVIVGAGASGVPAAITAREAGATVALIQKESTAISQGNTATGILLDTSDPAGVEAVVSPSSRIISTAASASRWSCGRRTPASASRGCSTWPPPRVPRFPTAR